MDPQQTLADVSAQVEWYGKLLKLAELQHTLVEQERTDDLLVVLDRRQKIVEQLTAIEHRLRPTKLGWHDIATTLEATHRAALESRFAEARTLLAAITQADQDDAMLLTQRKISVSQQLKQASSGRQMNQRYAANAYAGTGTRVNVSK